MASSLFSDVVFVEIADEPIIPASTFTDNGLTKQRPAKQNAYLWGGKRYPLPFTVKVPDSGPYRPGKYLIGGPVFVVGQYGLDFRTGQMTLVPMDEALKQLNNPNLKAA